MKLFAFFLFSLAVSKASSQEQKLAKFKGVVLDSRNSMPIADVYLFVVKGEEEGLTSRAGRLDFLITNKTPSVVHISHPDYKPTAIKLSSFSDKIIYLHSRNE
jgi:hypothetical protein